MIEPREPTQEFHYEPDPNFRIRPEASKDFFEASRETAPEKETEFLEAIRSQLSKWGQDTPQEKFEEIVRGDTKIAAKILSLLAEAGADRLSAIADRSEIFHPIFDYLKTREAEAVMKVFGEVGFVDDDERRKAIGVKLLSVTEDYGDPIQKLYEFLKVGPEHGGRTVLD